MAYEITASRKRPRSFDELAGQEFVSATLRSSLASGKIAHAYLFSGPRGCGKTSTARILARALNCERGPSAEPCGECDNCKAIKAGSSLDVIEIDGASNTSVDNVRQIKDEVLFPPNSSRYKIYIIDEVHMLSNSAFNALLKTIEEPPPYVIFMFATTELHKVPATIKSRCQQFGFRLIPLETIAGLLRQAAAEAGLKADEDALLWIAKEATGSARDAYTLFDQVAAFSEGAITVAKIRDKLGLVGLDRMNALMADCVRGERAKAFSALDALLDRGVSAEQWVADAVEYWRSILFLKQGIEKPGILGAPAAAFDAGVVEALSAEKIERALASLLSLHRELKTSVNPRFELELAVSRLCGLAQAITPAEAAKAVDSLRAYLRSGATAALPSSEGEKKKPEDLILAPSGTPFRTQVFIDERPVPSNPGLDASEPAPIAAGIAAESAKALASDRPGLSVFDEVEEEPMEAERSEYRVAEQGQEHPSAGPVVLPTRAAASAQPPGPSAASSDECAVSAPPGLDAASLREATLGLLRKGDFMLAGALDKALAWRLEGDRIVIEFDRPYEENLVKGDLALVSGRVAEAAGRMLKVDIRSIRDARDAGHADSSGAMSDAALAAPLEPDPVEIVERVFRGRRMPRRPETRREGDAS